MIGYGNVPDGNSDETDSGNFPAYDSAYSATVRLEQDPARVPANRVAIPPARHADPVSPVSTRLPDERVARRRDWYRVEDLLELVVPEDGETCAETAEAHRLDAPAGRGQLPRTAKLPQPEVRRAGLLRRLYRDSLLRNALFVFLSTSATAVLGFGFFVLAARLYSPDEIGKATTLISGMGLISYVSLLGLNVTIVRYLPSSSRQSDDINTGLVMVFTGGLVISVCYLLLVPVVAPRATILNASLVKPAVFVLLSAFMAVNIFTDSVFVAYRSTVYNLVADGFVQGCVKLALPALLVGLGGFGLTVSTGAGALAAAAVSVHILVRRFGFQLRPRVSRDVVRRVVGFSSANYVANLFNIAPPLLLPVVVVQQLGNEMCGYYYLAFMIANLIYSVSYAICQSLFAEASHGEEPVVRLARKAAVALAATIIPGSAILVLGRDLLLSSFGGAYVERAADALVVLALAAPVVAAYVLVTSLMRVVSAPALLIAVNVAFAGGVLGTAALWSGHGLTGVSLGWLAGHAGATILATIFLLFFHGGNGSQRRSIGEIVS